MTFEEWIKGEMGRGLSQLEVDQMRAAWMAALTAERMMSDKLKKALEYVLNDEMNLIPRATSSCRDRVRSALSEVAAIRAKQAERKGGQTRANP